MASATFLACRQCGYPRPLAVIARATGAPVKQVGKLCARMVAAEGGAIASDEGFQYDDNGDEDEDEENNVHTMGKVEIKNDEKRKTEAGNGGEENEGEGEECKSNKKQKTSPPPPKPKKRIKGKNGRSSSSSSISRPPESAVVSRILAVDVVGRVGSHLSLDAHLINVAKHACDKVREFSLVSSSSEAPQCVAAAMVICVSHVTKQPVDLPAITEVAVCSMANLSRTYSRLRPYIKTIFPKDFVLAQEIGVNALPLQLEEITRP
jgi:transcription initiation factor TFIIIB Brf1 subunit/transcription initiation factor TFIIB